MLSYLLYNSLIVIWCIWKWGEPSLHGWSEIETKNLGNVSSALQHFYFDQQSEKILQAF